MKKHYNFRKNFKNVIKKYYFLKFTNLFLFIKEHERHKQAHHACE